MILGGPSDLFPRGGPASASKALTKAEVRDSNPFGGAIEQRQRYRREDKKRIGFPLLPLLPHWRCYSPMNLISTRLRRPPSNSPEKICPQGPKSSWPAVIATTTSRPMIWRFIWASALP